MAEEFTCDSCRKAKLVEPPQSKFGEVSIIKLDSSEIDTQVDAALGSKRYEVIGKRKEYICDKCLQDARTPEFIGLAVFYGILMILSWITNTDEMVQLFLIVGFIGTAIYFILRNSDNDVRDQLLKTSLKKIGKVPITRKESKYLQS